LGRATLGTSNVIQFKAEVKNGVGKSAPFFLGEGSLIRLERGSFYSGNGRAA
jgi:hypothetical protein